jgi:lipase chaperone LimK
MRWHWSWLFAGVALALIGWIAFRLTVSAKTEAPALVDETETVAKPTERPQTVAAPQTTVEAASVALAPSLRGTEVDGALERDQSGHFIPTPRALQLFDYFLTESGEQNAATIRAQVLAAAQQRLPSEEVERALSLYDRYVDYHARLQDAFARAPLASGPRAALAITEAMQADVFGREDAERLFSADNTLAEVTVARAELAVAERDPDARATLAAALEERLPEPMRRARASRAEIAAHSPPTP